MPSKKKSTGKKNSTPGAIETKQQASKTGPGKKTVSKNSFFIVTIGASAGGLNAISELVTQLPSNLNAAVLIVIHLSKAAIGDFLLERIRKNSKLPCQIGRHGDAIARGQIYIAAPDEHLLINDNKIIIGHGPPENRFRPSIDVLFRSAAASAGERVIGIVLTGLLNDGTAGMMAIKQCGGYCIVQDPNEAEYPSMPLSVLENMEADHCVSLKAMGDIIERITQKQIVKRGATPQNVIVESRLSELAATGLDGVSRLGKKTLLACPDCGGGLWVVKNGWVKHYRCHIGHSYSEQDLDVKQSEKIESTMWVAVRMMEERKLLINRLAKENNERGLRQLSQSYEEQGQHLEEHITRLKELIFGINTD